MRRRVMVGMIAVVVLTGMGVLLTAIPKQRQRADRLACLARFERLGQFAALYTHPPPDRLPQEIPQVVPPGTIPNLALPPDQRLSWIAGALPLLDQKLQPIAELATRLDRSAAWDAAPNREVATTRLSLFTCPGAMPEVPPGEPMPTQFVGLAGVGPDGATLGLGPPVPNRAGCFRYDEPTPLRTIRDGDGLSNTVLFAETAAQLGPWIRGGFATVRSLDVSSEAKPFLGPGGQFGGNYPMVNGFGFADGSARFFRIDTSPEFLRSLFTIAGQGFDPPLAE
jgi:hypothetical protein